MDPVSDTPVVDESGADPEEVLNFGFFRIRRKDLPEFVRLTEELLHSCSASAGVLEK